MDSTAELKIQLIVLICCKRICSMIKGIKETQLNKMEWSVTHLSWEILVTIGWIMDFHQVLLISNRVEMETSLSTKWIKNSSKHHSSNSNADKSFKEKTKALLKKDKTVDQSNMQLSLSEIKSTLLIIIKANRFLAKQVSNQMGWTILKQLFKSTRITKMRDHMTLYQIWVWILLMTLVIKTRIARSI